MAGRDILTPLDTETQYKAQQPRAPDAPLGVLVLGVIAILVGAASTLLSGWILYFTAGGVSVLVTVGVLGAVLVGIGRGFIRLQQWAWMGMVGTVATMLVAIGFRGFVVAGIVVAVTEAYVFFVRGLFLH